ncbi:MAG: VCBS repeat-containing protein, partial [Bacteroidota bacterium]
QLGDINQDGRPEVYVGDRIFDALTGIRYVDGGGNVNVGGYATGNNSDRFPLYFDLYQPNDPKPGGGTFGPEANGMEYIAGNQVWTVDFTTGTANSGNFQLAAEYDGPTNNRDGLTSIADINGDGRMDVAVMDGGRVYAWDPYTNQRIGPDFDVPGTSSGGRINIGDFDGDGDVELGFAGRNIYIVRRYEDNDGDGDPNDGTWSDLWRKTGLDDGSQRTGSTLFDFDGDGRVEVVYSEEEDLFIYDGATGTELFRTTSRSGTRTEYPLVADVNGDGTAEIIVTAQERNGPQFSGTGWISVYTSANQPWVPARPVWNQHGYNVVNVNDDLTVPRFQQNPLNPALGNRYNNFLVQTAVGGDEEGNVVYPAPDAIIMAELDGDGDPIIDFSDCPNTITINLQVDNAGSAPLPASTPISFYDGDPSAVAANLITSTVLGTQVDTGGVVIVPVTIDVSSVPAGSPIWLSVNDPGFAAADLPFQPEDFPLTGTAECDYTNNVSNVGNVRCGEVCGNGIDDDGDGLTDEP